MMRERSNQPSLCRRHIHRHGRALLTERQCTFPTFRQRSGLSSPDLRLRPQVIACSPPPLCFARAAPIGAITVTGAEPEMFTERQIDHAPDVRGPGRDRDREHAAVQRAADAQPRLTESLEQQTATSEILRVISQSQRDVQPVFEAIAANARKLCGANTGSVITFDGELIHLRGCRGLSVPKRLEALRRSVPMRPSRGGALAAPSSTRASSMSPMFARIRSIACKAWLRRLDIAAPLSCRCFAKAAHRSDQRHRRRDPRCSPSDRSTCSRPSPTRR